MLFSFVFISYCTVLFSVQDKKCGQFDNNSNKLDYCANIIYQSIQSIPIILRMYVHILYQCLFVCNLFTQT